MRKPELFIHEGHEIVFLDFSNLKNKDEIIQLILDGAKVIRSKPKNSVLSLVSIENMFFNNEIRAAFTDNVKNNNPYVKRSTVYGLKGLILIMLKSFLTLSGRDLKSFNNKEEALNYLIKE